MTDEEKDLKQRLSMLLDGELNGRDNTSFIIKLENDEEMKAKWARYNLIGQVMRSPKGMLVDSDFATRISAAIGGEPTVLAPKNNAKASETLRHRVVTVALAASLAGVAVLIGESLTDHASELRAGMAQSVRVSAVGANTQVAGENAEDAQFNDYLVTHNETAYMAGSAGMLSYVRMVSSGSDR